MRITAEVHYIDGVKGFYLITDKLKVWYKGETSKDAVRAFIKDRKIKDAHITIIEEVRGDYLCILFY